MISGNVFPRSTDYGPSDSLFWQVENLADSTIRASLLPHLSALSDFFLCQFCRVLPFSTWTKFGIKPCGTAITRCLSMLRNHIRRIVGMVSFFQVRGIAAGPIVAFVKNQNMRPFPLVHEIGEPVGFHCAVVNPEDPITPAGNFKLPLPAVAIRALAGRFINVRPKSLNVLVGKAGRVYSWKSHSLNHLSVLVRAVRGVRSIAAACLYCNTIGAF